MAIFLQSDAIDLKRMRRLRISACRMDKFLRLPWQLLSVFLVSGAAKIVNVLIYDRYYL